jgi:hypothetical protein
MTWNICSTTKRKQVMKKIKISACLLATFMLAACDAGFDEINTSKTGILSINPAYMFNNTMVRSSFPQQTLVFEIAIVQQMVTPNSGVVSGGNYNQDNRGVTVFLWQRYYRDVMKSVADVLDKTRDDAVRSNLYNMARIWRAYAIMVLTDTYGDVPFQEAALGYLEGIITPAYDTQEFIYTTILSELEQAAAALDGDLTIETSDILYGGDIAKWKKLAYSLMLRAGMRLSEVAPSTAALYVGKAVAGGVMESNADNALIRHTANYTNEISAWLTGTEASNFYLARPFVDQLKTTNDPRLASIAVRYEGAESGAEQTAEIATRDPAKQTGMPMGYDNGTIVPIAAGEGLASFYAYSQLDRTRMGKTTAPMFFVTYAQTNLLLAEAVERTWATGDADLLYAEGIRAHMKQMADYDANSAISDADIEQYIADHLLTGGTEFEQINTQYWIASFLNGPEAFANFRRSGFPALAPNPYPGKSIEGDFINRLTYPDTEFSVNSENVQEAVNRQEPTEKKDIMDTRVWWDLP